MHNKYLNVSRNIILLFIFSIWQFIYTNIYTTSQVTQVKTVFASFLIFGLIVIEYLYYLNNKNPDNNFRINIFSSIIYIYFIINIVRIFFNRSYYAGIEEGYKIILNFLIFILFSTYKNKINDKLKWIFNITFLCILSYGLLQILNIDFLFNKPLGRIFSFYGNPNFYSPYIIVSLGLLLGVFRLNNHKILTILIIFLSILNIYFTKTRAGYLAFITIIVLFLLKKTFYKSKIQYVIILLISIISLSFFTKIYVYKKIKRHTGTIYERTLLWRSALDMIKDNPVFGHGIGEFTNIYPYYAKPEFFKLKQAENVTAGHCHNEFLETAVESGILNLGIFLLLFLTLANFLFHKKNNVYTDIWILSIIGIFVSNLFSVNFRYITTTFYLWISLSFLYQHFNGFSFITFRKTNIYYITLMLFGIVTIIVVSSIFQSQSFLQWGINNENKAKTYTHSSYYQKAYKTWQGNSSAAFKLGFFYYKNKRYKTAVEWFNKTREISPFYPTVLYTIGTTYYKAEEYFKSLKNLIAETRFNPFFVKAYNNIGNIYIEFKDYQTAIKYYRLAKYFNPDFKIADINLGITYTKMNQPDLSIQYFENTIKTDPNYVYAYYNLLRIYDKKMDYINILAILSKFIQQYQNNTDLKTNKYFDDIIKLLKNNAIKLYNANHYDKAIHIMNKLKLLSNDKDLYHKLALMYSKINKNNETIQAYYDSIKFNPVDNEQTYLRLGGLLQKQKRYKDTIKLYEKAIKHNPDNYKFYLTIGMVYNNVMQQPGKAYQYWKKAHKLNPQNQEINNVLNMFKQYDK